MILVLGRIRSIGMEGQVSMMTNANDRGTAQVAHFVVDGKKYSSITNDLSFDMFFMDDKGRIDACTGVVVGLSSIFINKAGGFQKYVDLLLSNQGG
jgi:hypothetical protein